MDVLLNGLKFVSIEQDKYARRLDNAKNNVEIIRFVEQHYFEEEKEQIPKIQSKAKKSAKRSDKYREKGNQFYIQRNFIEALKLFNQSISFAPNDSVQLSKGYANRSAVYLSMRMYEFSLKNIKLARDTGYPAELMPKLVERETKCQRALAHSEQSTTVNFIGLKPQLSYPVHDKVPFIANCLELKVNGSYGRHIVATSDLKVGDIVAIEHSFCGVTTLENRYLRCANCLQENDFDLLPCPNCHSAMFCSPECYAQAVDEFHDIECPIMDILLSPKLIHPRERVTARLMILIVKSYKTIDDLVKFTKNLEKREQNVFTIDYVENRNNDLLASVLKLQGHADKSNAMRKHGVGWSTAILYRAFLNYTTFKELFRTKKEIDFFIDLLHRINNVANLNAHAIDNLKEFSGETEEASDRFCFGIYPFNSLINHSCTPNTMHIKHGTDNVVIIIKPIQKGEQLFTSYYDLHHRTVKRDKRQQELQETYYFKCKCSACTKDYPQMNFRELIENNAVVKPVKHIAFVRKYDMETIKELIPKYCEYLNEKSKACYPYELTSIAEEFLTKFWCVVFTDRMSLVTKQNLQAAAD